MGTMPGSGIDADDVRPHFIPDVIDAGCGDVVFRVDEDSGQARFRCRSHDIHFVNAIDGLFDGFGDQLFNLFARSCPAKRWSPRRSARCTPDSSRRGMVKNEITPQAISSATMV